MSGLATNQSTKCLLEDGSNESSNLKLLPRKIECTDINIFTLFLIEVMISLHLFCVMFLVLFIKLYHQASWLYSMLYFSQPIPFVTQYITMCGCLIIHSPSVPFRMMRIDVFILIHPRSFQLPTFICINLQKHSLYPIIFINDSLSDSLRTFMFPILFFIYSFTLVSRRHTHITM